MNSVLLIYKSMWIFFSKYFDLVFINCELRFDYKILNCEDKKFYCWKWIEIIKSKVCNCSSALNKYSCPKCGTYINKVLCNNRAKSALSYENYRRRNISIENNLSITYRLFVCLLFFYLEFERKIII